MYRGGYQQKRRLSQPAAPVNLESEKSDLWILLMKKFAWGGVDKYDVYLDENVLRMVSNLRSNFSRLSNALIDAGDSAKAIEVLDKCQQVLPEKNVPYSIQA